MKSCLTLIGLAVVAFFVPISAHSATIVVPASNTATEGNENSGFPFNLGPLGFSSMRYQQLYAASEFSSLMPGGEFITQITFRPDAIYGAPFASNLKDIQINLSTTRAFTTTLSATFAANVGPNDTIVVPRGPLSLSSTDSGPAAGPKVFDIVINLAVPFFYNPAAGDLLLDVRNFSNQQPTAFFDSHNSPDSQTVRVFATDVTSATGTFDDFTRTGLVTRFTTVPEANTTTLLLLFLCGFSTRRTRKRA
jgi:hypothetical protein